MPRARLSTSVLALVVLLACGCDRAPAPAATPAAVAGPPDIVAVVANSGDEVVGRIITVRFTAPAAHALAIDNCNGAMSWALERRQGTAWQPAWNAETDACLSHPFLIGAGQSREYEKVVDKRAVARLPAGTYRVVVHSLYGGPDPRGADADALLDLERRTSAPFHYDAAGGP
jgi:hypothetical protein